MFGHKDDHQTDGTNQDQAAAQAIDGFLPAHTASHPSNVTPAGPAPSANFIMTDTPTADTDEPASMPAPSYSAPSGSDDLLALKQQALQQLSPLIDHLDQEPEDKFRTTMMMLQSTDDQNLVRPAYEAAQAIPDEKVRAQALLDVINEINYFTQQNNQEG